MSFLEQDFQNKYDTLRNKLSTIIFLKHMKSVFEQEWAFQNINEFWRMSFSS